MEERALVAGKHRLRGVIASISAKTKSRGQQKAMVAISDFVSDNLVISTFFKQMFRHFFLTILGLNPINSLFQLQ